MQLPEEIRVQLLLNGVPIAGMFAYVSLDTGGPLRFTAGPGPSDQDGFLVITGEQLRQVVDAIWSATPEWVRAGHSPCELKGVAVRPKNRDALHRTLAAHRSGLASGHNVAAIRSALDQLASSVGGELEARGTVLGWDGPVEWHSAPV